MKIMVAIKGSKRRSECEENYIELTKFSFRDTVAFQISYVAVCSMNFFLN